MQKKRQALQCGVGTGPWTRNDMNKAVSYKKTPLC